MWFSCFPILTGSAEAQVIWGGIVKRPLIAYFIGNISAKKNIKMIHVHPSYSKPKVGRFFETRRIIYTPPPKKKSKLDLTTDAEYAANLVNVSIWL